MSDTISKAYAAAIAAISELAEEARRNDHAFQLDALKHENAELLEQVATLNAPCRTLFDENERLKAKATAPAAAESGPWVATIIEPRGRRLFWTGGHWSNDLARAFQLREPKWEDAGRLVTLAEATKLVEAAEASHAGGGTSETWSTDEVTDMIRRALFDACSHTRRHPNTWPVDTELAARSIKDQRAHRLDVAAYTEASK